MRVKKGLVKINARRLSSRVTFTFLTTFKRIKKQTITKLVSDSATFFSLKSAYFYTFTLYDLLNLKNFFKSKET